MAWKTNEIKMGGYTILIEFNSENEILDITVSDELGDIIESLTISNDTDEIDPNMN